MEYNLGGAFLELYPSGNIPWSSSLHSDLSSFWKAYELPLQGSSKGIEPDISKAKIKSPYS